MSHHWHCSCHIHCELRANKLLIFTLQGGFAWRCRVGWLLKGHHTFTVYHSEQPNYVDTVRCLRRSQWCSWQPEAGHSQLFMIMIRNQSDIRLWIIANKLYFTLAIIADSKMVEFIIVVTLGSFSFSLFVYFLCHWCCLQLSFCICRMRKTFWFWEVTISQAVKCFDASKTIDDRRLWSFSLLLLTTSELQTPLTSFPGLHISPRFWFFFLKTILISSLENPKVFSPNTSSRKSLLVGSRHLRAAVWLHISQHLSLRTDVTWGSWRGASKWHKWTGQRGA